MKTKRHFLIVACLLACHFSMLYPIIALGSLQIKTSDHDKAIILSDIHLNPFWGKTPVNELIAAPVDQWFKLFNTYNKDQIFSKVHEDTNIYLFLSALDVIKKKCSEPKYFLITGDLICHEQYLEVAEKKITLIRKKIFEFINYEIRKRFGSVIVIPALGNNDTDHGDNMMPSKSFLNSFLSTFNIEPLRFEYPENNHGAYYSFRISGGLKILIFNTTVFQWNNKNEEAIACLQWLKLELHNSLIKHENVWLASHIPPGTDVPKSIKSGKLVNTFESRYKDSITKYIIAYAPIIKFNVAGHTHANDFRIFYNDQHQAVSFVRIVPSLTPYFGNNPSFEIVAYDNLTGDIVDENNYFFRSSITDSIDSASFSCNQGQYFSAKIAIMEKLDKASSESDMKEISSYAKVYASWSDATGPYSFTKYFKRYIEAMHIY